MQQYVNKFHTSINHYNGEVIIDFLQERPVFGEAPTEITDTVVQMPVAGICTDVVAQLVMPEQCARNLYEILGSILNGVEG